MSTASARTPTGEKRKLHPLSPLIATAPIVPVALIFVYFIGSGALFKYGVLGIPAGFPVALALILAFLGYHYLSWRKLDYWFDDSGDIRIDSGIVYRNERKMQLSRLQSVDVEQPLVARIFGYALLKIEAAGDNSKAVLSFLTLPDAEALRREILSRSAGESHEQAQQPVHFEEAVIAKVPDKDLALSLLLRSSTAGLLLFTVALVAWTYISEGVGGLLLLPITGGIPIFMVVTEFVNLYGFTAAQAKDGLRLRHGLLSRQAQFVPPGRVQAVDFVQSLLWRPFGWVRVRITVAGVAGSNDGDAKLSQSVLMPVAKWEEARDIVARIMPGVNIDAIALTPAPKIARWRSPIQGSRLAVGFSDDVFVTRRGQVTRYLTVTPHARTQSVRVTQGPWQRSLGLATMHVDIPPGPITVEALQQPAAEARAIAQAQAVRARSARAADTSTRWASPGPASAPPAPVSELDHQGD